MADPRRPKTRDAGSPLRLYLSHDGAVDDFLALAVAAVTPEVELVGVQLIDGDCVAEHAWDLQARLLDLLGKSDVPTSLSRARPFNPFPWSYRTDCLRLAAAPPLAERRVDVAPPPWPDGEQAFQSALEAAAEPLTVLATGPLTPIQMALESRPELAGRIERLVWMGGAVDAAGNLEPATLPGLPLNCRAEWNAFWDPFAVDWVFRHTDFPLVIVPLDAVDAARLDPEFLSELERQGKTHPLSQVAWTGYAAVLDQPLYRLWDVSTAVWLLEPTLFGPPRPERLGVTLYGPQQGGLVRDPEGREAWVVPGFRPGGVEDLYRRLLTTWR